ncbi:MAG: response regulator [Cyanobacteria bacterium SIG30]|nr:response regulator [Cyanobacteria bacterium SIG30]
MDMDYDYNYNVKLNREQVIDLFRMADIDANPDLASSDDISRALISIEKKLNFFNYPLNFFASETINVLIVDDMELSIYQLNSMLKKIGANVFVSRNKEEAITEIKKKRFDYIIIDLFLPDSQDGLELVEFANQYKQNAEKDFKIVVISGTDDPALIEEVYKHGVDEFVSKQPKWHEKIMKFISVSTTRNDNEDFNQYVINDNISVFTIYKINNERYIKNLFKEVSTAVLSGKKNIILNMEYVKIFSDNYASIFVEIYKIVTEQNGQFVIVKPSKDVTTALEYVFLNDTIPSYETIEQAVSCIEINNLE